jgi:hypothetical protein
MDNITMSEVPTGPAPAQAPIQEVPLDVQLVNTPITDENVALNVLVAYIGLAQKRGSFNIQESAKIWDCIKQFNPQAK